MPDPQPRTIFYKKVGALEVPLDVYIPEDAQHCPVLIWFHGGGCLQGKRTRISPHHIRGVNKYKYIFVSADYRLAPQVGIADIFEDVKDCIEFVRTQLPEHVGECAIDTGRLALSGSSAGGDLALLAGLYAEPKPKAVLAIYPITDPFGPFFAKSQPPLPGSSVPEVASIKEFLDPTGEVVAFNELDSKRMTLYFHMLDKANLPELLRMKPGDDTYRVARKIYERGMPPTYVVHGDADGAVGVEQADEVVGVLTGLGITVGYERLHGVNHMFDRDEKCGLERMYEFMAKHV